MRERVSKAATVRKIFSDLTGLELLGSTSVFATRTFAFGHKLQPPQQNAVFTLVVECPWRIESGDEILTGFDDYRIPAAGNLDPSWDPNSQTGSLQEQRLTEWLGADRQDGKSSAFDRSIVVNDIEADEFGGLRIILSGACCLSVFPASAGEMEWMLRKVDQGYVLLMKGQLAGTLLEP